MFDIFLILPWLAIIILNAGYFAQIYKIYTHKEVRDLSATSYILFVTAYSILAIESFHISSTIFLVKNIVTALTTSVIIFCIWFYKDEEWHDDEDKICDCGNELEPHWKYCADCGSIVANKKLEFIEANSGLQD